MGDYKVSVFVAEDSGQNLLEVIENICPFNVKMLNKHRDYDWQPNSCAYLEEFNWSELK